VVGAVALRANDGDLPRWRALRLAAWAYLIAAALLAAPWAGLGIGDVRLIDFAPPDKTNLAPARLLDILAIAYLALSSPGCGGSPTEVARPWSRATPFAGGVLVRTLLGLLGACCCAPTALPGNSRC